MNFFPGLLGLALILGACTSKVETAEHLNPPVQGDFLDCHKENNLRSIVNGYSVRTYDSDSKRAVLLIIQQGDEISACTGAPVSNRVILTAAHCVEGASKGKVTAIFHPQMTCASGYIRSKMAIPSVDIIQHEKYNPKESHFHDLALVQLSTPIPADYPIASFYDGVGSLSSDEVLMIGYGVTDDSKKDSLILRKTIKSYSRDSYSRGQRISFDQRNVTGGVCRGDSGGPVYVKVDGEYKIIGINSVVTHEEHAPCREVSIAMYMPTYQDWVQENLKKFQQ